MNYFKYTYTQKNGKVSVASVNLDDVIHAKLVKIDEEKEGVTTEVEGIILETKHSIQQPMELPIEQARTREDKIAGRRNISHAKWELGWFLFTITVGETQEVEQLKKHFNLNLNLN